MRQVPQRRLAGWLLFSGLHLFNALFHRQWADELQAWSIVRESSNLSELHWHLQGGSGAVFGWQDPDGRACLRRCCRGGR